MKRILCYGDSNTWGFIPGTGERYPADVRWPGVLAALLGRGVHVVENGINGRTTAIDDPGYPCRNGKEGLGYALLAEKPFDLVILMLGTNDLKLTDAAGAARERTFPGQDACVPRQTGNPARFAHSHRREC